MWLVGYKIGNISCGKKIKGLKWLVEGFRNGLIGGVELLNNLESEISRDSVVVWRFLFG